MLFSSCASSLATPKNLHNIPSVEHVQKASKDHSKHASTERSGDIESANLAKKYAEYIKKAAAALQIKKPLDYEVEKNLWDDYKAGKHAKNKTFTNNMRLAEPIHIRIRAVLKNFERNTPNSDSPMKHRNQPVGDFNASDKTFDPHKDNPNKANPTKK